VGVPRAPYITDWVQSSDFGVRTIPRHWDAEDFWCFSHAFVISRGFLEVLVPFFLNILFWNSTDMMQRDHRIAGSPSLQKRPRYTELRAIEVAAAFPA